MFIEILFLVLNAFNSRICAVVRFEIGIYTFGINLVNNVLLNPVDWALQNVCVADTWQAYSHTPFCERNTAAFTLVLFFWKR